MEASKFNFTEDRIQKKKKIRYPIETKFKLTPGQNTYFIEGKVEFTLKNNSKTNKKIKISIR